MGTSPTPTLEETQTTGRVETFMRTEEPCEDTVGETKPQSPHEPLATTNAVSNTTSAMDVVDLYTAGHVSLCKTQMENKEAVPFIHQIRLKGPNGELVRVRALFDDGAMVPAMCSSIFTKVKHRLHNLQPSTKRLRMANGTIISSEAKWSGMVELNGVQALGEFEVFDSGGGWAFLFGKPMLQAFHAIHDYTTDSITVTNNSRSTILMNQVAHANAMQQAENGISLTLDIKQRDIPAGGMETPSSRQSICKIADQEIMPRQQLMGQWKHLPTTAQRDKRRIKQLLRRAKLVMHQSPLASVTEPKESEERSDTVGSVEPPSREVQPTTTSHTTPSIDMLTPIAQVPTICVISDNDATDPSDEQLGELPEFPATSDNSDNSIYTRQTWPDNPARVKKILSLITFGQDLSPDQRSQLESFVRQRAGIFALSLTEVIPIPGAALNLNVPENANFNLRIHQRPLTPEQAKFFNARVDDMLDADMIERAPPELVKCAATTVITQKTHQSAGLSWNKLKYKINEECKSEGHEPAFEMPEREVNPPPHNSQADAPRKWRMCQNFNQLNKVTEIAPMPQGDILAKQQRLSGHKYVSVFDFAAGFYAIEVPDKWRPFLAFHVEGRGYFWYKRMPMGITGAPTIFCDTTAAHLHDLLTSFLMELFIDDGACAANTFEDMLNKLTIIFDRFKACHFSIAPAKTQLCMTEAVFAGNTVGPNGVQPDLTKLTAIVDWARPEDALNLASFLGLTGHYRSLIKAYAKRENPLRDLLLNVPLTTPYNKTSYRKAMSDFKLARHWTQAHTNAFLDLKIAITSRPVIQAPRYDGSPFVITSDGCAEGFAAVLSQRVRTQTPNGKWIEKLHPIGFASKRTSLAEQRYKSYLLEFAALKFGLDKFSNIIWGSPVEVETDCNALKDTLLGTNLNTAHARWREGILSYSIVDVRHVPGKLNVVADGLSRKWEGQPRAAGDGSEWSVNEDWEARIGIVNDIMLISPADPETDALRLRFAKEPLFLEVINALSNTHHEATLRDRRRAQHRSSQHIIEGGKLWRLRGGSATRARTKVECITKEEAIAEATKAHREGGHWGRDAIKMSLLDRICSPKLDASILTVIRDCAKCKNFGPTYVHSLLEPITRRHPFELLVGDYLTLPKGKGGYSNLGVYLDTFSQHVWVTKHKSAGSAKTTIEGLTRIFNGFIAPETFMSDGGKHFNNEAVKNFCESRACKLHIIAAYSPWVNGLVEGTNKLLLHILKRLCAPELGEDNCDETSWDKLPKTWPNHLENAVHALNHRLLPALKFTPKELLLGLVINTPPTPLEESSSVLRPTDALTQIAYVEQQRLDGYDEIIRHAIKRKATFDKKLLQRSPGEVVFKPGQLVQVYRNDLDYTFSAERKIVPKWSVPRRIRGRLLNSYKLESLEGTLLQGEFSARRLRAFTPRAGTKLAKDQLAHEEQLTKREGVQENESNELESGRSTEGQDIEVDIEEEIEDEDEEEQTEDGDEGGAGCF